jgi:hypothetical protein
MLRPVLAASLCALGLVLAAPAAGVAATPKRPPGWPKHLAVGAADQPGGATSLRRAGRVDMRYQYLTGGVDTGNGWATWNANGTFVSRYVAESRRARVLPVFTWYQVLMTRPGRPGGEAEKDLANIADPSVTRELFADFRLMLRRIGRARAVVHVEPDLWGFVQMRSRGDDAATVPAAVAASGDPATRRLPDNAAGLARAFIRLRNRLAPRVVLAWHLSSWGTNRSHTASDFTPAQTRALARRSARFYRSLHARYDVVFNDVADRDDGWRRHIAGEQNPTHHFDRPDFARHDLYLRTFTRATRTPVALWQLPVGSSRLPDTWQRFRDNRLQWWLGRGNRAHLRRTARAGVIGLLFGAGADGCTTPRTDGGVFFRLARAYAGRRLRL